MSTPVPPPMEEAQYVELLWPVVPTGEVDGALDWFAGVMALDISHETWQHLGAQPPAVQSHVARVYAHEVFHFVQLVTMGFMHDWAADLFQLVRPVVLRVQQGVQAGDYAGIKRIIKLGPALLSDAEAEAIERHFLKLDSPGRSGLTTRAIIETQAHFAERRLNHEIEQSFQWTPHLRDAPAPVYRVALDVLAFVAGYEAAFHWFSLAASMSLCTANPVETFERLALALADDDAARALSSSQADDVPRMVDFVLESLPDVAWFTPLQGTGKEHPVFTPVAQALAAMANAGTFDLFRFFVRPDGQIMPLLKQKLVEAPILFKPAPPSALAIQTMDGVSEGTILAMFVLGALGHRLTRTAESASLARGDASMARLAWLVRDHTPILVDLAGEDLHSGNPERMLRLFDPANENTRAAWGRIVLRVPAEVDPAQDVLLWRVPTARRLLRAIYRRMPGFPIYLGVPFGPLEWFGCVGHDSTDVEPDWSGPRIRGLVAEAERAIHEHADSVGQNPWLVVERFVRPWKRA